MATIAQIFFPGITDDDQAFGTTVKKILESAPTTTSTTTNTWTTATVETRTHVPLAASSVNSDTSNANGWAYNNGGADGLGSTSTEKRIIPAGVWAFSMDYTLNTPALLATIACTVTARVYRVAASPFTRTPLFTAASANFSATGVQTWNSTSQPVITLEAGEVIMVGFTAASAATAATVLGAITNTVLTLNLGANSKVTVPSPGVRTSYLRSSDNVGIGTTSRSFAADLSRAAVGKGTATSTKATVASKSFDLVSKGTATRVLALAIPRSPVGKGDVTFSRATAAAKSFSLAGVGTPARVLDVGLSRTPVGKGTTSPSKAVVAAKTFNLAGIGTTLYSKNTQAQRTFNLAGIGTTSVSRAAALTFTVVGIGTTTSAKAVTASKSFTIVGRGEITRVIAVSFSRQVDGKGVVSYVKATNIVKTFALVGKGTILVTGPNASTITLPIDELPDGGAPPVIQTTIFAVLD